MKKVNNLYNYSIPKSSNEESSYFLTKGRITFVPFFLRLLLCCLIYLISFFITAYFTELYVYKETEGGKVTDESVITWFNVTQALHFYIIPILLIGFLLIQGAKRMHDINKSGLYFLIPGYNIYLSFLKGTIGSNNYGIDPNPAPRVEYFDELEIKKETASNLSSPQNLGNKWGFIMIFISILIFLFFVFIKDTEVESLVLTTVDSSAVIKPENTTKIKNNYKKTVEQDLSEDLDSINVDSFNELDTIESYVDEKSSNVLIDNIKNESKSIRLINNTTNVASFAYAFWNNNKWETIGWYNVDPNNSRKVILPQPFSGDNIYWYAYSKEANWGGNDGVFCIDRSNAFHFFSFKSNENCESNSVNFHKLILNGSESKISIGYSK
jgi:uncharacterized membrane protein YhaH (DUF805 family)/uncharacterized membrane protein